MPLDGWMDVPKIIRFSGERLDESGSFFCRKPFVPQENRPSKFQLIRINHHGDLGNNQTNTLTH